MVRKGYTPEQIIGKLREAEILLNQGTTVGEASRGIGVTEQTYYRWRREYGGMRERAFLIGGEFAIESQPGAGTTIFLEVPLNSTGEVSDKQDKVASR
jgi:transposase-like protein